MPALISIAAVAKRIVESSLALSGVMTMFAGCGFLPGGYYYNQIHAHDPGIHDFTYHLGDVDGEVGHQFHHSFLNINCQPSRQWSLNSSLASGTLPPGLTMDGSVIRGIPLERGHWIVHVSVSDVTCNGRIYPAFDGERELRFHITGTGKVIR